MSEVLLQARGVSLQVDDKGLLDQVDLTVPEGVALAIIGPNGAGKTTLLRCLLGLQAGWTGEISVAGEPLGGIPQRERARRMSYVPQAEGRSIPYQVREFVAMSRYPYLSAFGTLTHQDWQAVDRALELTGMASFGERMLRTLSGGECQQVFIAAALAQEARTLLLDEPTAFLDYGHRGRIHEILRSVRTETGATVLVTHDLNEAVAVCDRVIALREGRVVHSGTVAETLDREVLHRIYGVEFVITTVEGRSRPVVFPEVLP